MATKCQQISYCVAEVAKTWVRVLQLAAAVLVGNSINVMLSAV